jgi:hypothetical protein
MEGRVITVNNSVLYNTIAANEIFSPSNKIHGEVGRAKKFISTPVQTS